jgi:hypothetical protein
MLKGLPKYAFGTMAVLAVGIAFHAMRYMAVPWDIWLGVDAGIRSVIEHVPLQALTHMIVAPIALLAGPFQFLPGLRARRPRLHRWTGRIYVTACLIAGLAALATAPFASGGPIAGAGFAILAVLWVSTTFAAWRAAVARRFDQHRLLMRFSYAMTFAAVTLRLQVPIGFMLGYPSYPAMSVWLAYTSWIPNVIVVALYSLVKGTRRQAVPVAAE